MAKKFTYNVKNRITIESTDNFITCLGTVSWNNNPYKLELRRWIVNGDNVVPQKGVTLNTEEGANRLTEVLVKMGYGDTAKLAVMLSQRDEYEMATANVGDQDAEIEDTDLFTIGDILNTISK